MNTSAARGALRLSFFDNAGNASWLPVRFPQQPELEAAAGGIWTPAAS